MFGMGDEMFGKWETKCSVFRIPKVRLKSPEAYQEAQIKKKNIVRTFLGTTIDERSIEHPRHCHHEFL